MREYQKFSVNDFAMDEYFQSWVLHSNDATEAFWNAFLIDHPEKSTTLNEAREILTNFRLPRYSLSQEEVSKLWQNIKKEKISPDEKLKESFFSRLWQNHVVRIKLF